MLILILCAHMREVLKLKDAEVRPLWYVGVADPTETRSSTMCYHATFRRSRSNRFSVGRGPQNFGDAWARPLWNGDMAELLEICFSSACSAVPNLVILGQPVWT